MSQPMSSKSVYQSVPKRGIAGGIGTQLLGVDGEDSAADGTD
jgi:hypothetical protein